MGRETMTKWIIVFLALANGLLFYVISGQSASTQNENAEQNSAIQRIKLVSEVGLTDPDQVVGRTDGASGNKQASKKSCWLLTEIQREQDQQALSDFLVEQAFQPILRLPNSKHKDYQIALGHRFDQKTNDAVHRLIKERYPSVKIEKKVCEGVAY
jgi:hypothetical protein